jgi:hypothetical protein
VDRDVLSLVHEESLSLQPNSDVQKLAEKEEARYLVLEALMDEVMVVVDSDVDVQDQQKLFAHVKQYD